MSTAEPDAVVFDAYGIPEKAPFAVRARRLLRQHPLGAFGFLIVLIVIFLAAVGPLIAGDAESISADILVGPSGEHWFGTDRLGRDYLARVIAGARLSMSLALGAMAIGVGAALVLGMVSAYAKGAVDLFLQRIIDMLLAFPGLVLLLLLSQVIGRGLAIGGPRHGNSLRGQHGPHRAS